MLEVKVLCEVVLPHDPLLDDLDGDLASQLHGLPEVVVIRLAGQQCPASEELVERAPQRPGVHGLGVLAAKDHLRRPVEAAGQVRRAAHVLHLNRRAEVTELHDVVALADQDVVGLDVRVDDRVLVHVGQSDQKLLRVGSHGLQGHALVLCVLLQCGPQVVPHALEDKAKVLPVVERGEQADDVPLVVLVRVVQSLQDLHLLLGSLCHHVVGAHDLDGD
mmetsp:Transcript_121859/g.356152  ORF Transcript_121859/g.356152 Transcript_121859/m.356152 type:complete len:219 (+) Transcript_121859:395-1051(+)